MKSSKISAGTMMRSRLELTFSVIRTTRPRALLFRSIKKVFLSAMIFSVQIISSSTFNHKAVFSCSLSSHYTTSGVSVNHQSL